MNRKAKLVHGEIKNYSYLMNFKFKQPPFYLYIILWIVALALGLQFDKKFRT